MLRHAPRPVRGSPGQQLSRRSASRSSDPVILDEDALQQLLDHLDEDEDDERREVDPAEIRKDAADRPIEWRRDAVDRDGQGAHPARAGVEHVEGEQPAQDDLGDDDPGDDAEQQVGDIDESNEHDRGLAGRLLRCNQGANLSGSATLRISAKSPAGSDHWASGVHPPASNSTRPPRWPYLWLFSTWIDASFAIAKLRPDTLKRTSRVATRWISIRDKMSFHRASWRKSSTGMSPSSSRLMRVKRLSVN